MSALRSSRAGRGLTDDRLGEHDMDVLRTLAAVRTASTDQLARLHFPTASVRAHQRCLARLSRERLVTRVARRVGGVSPGSTPWAYGLSLKGQRLLGVAGPRGGRARSPWVPSPLFLRHTLLVTEVYVSAVEVTREREIEVMDFVTEPDCWRFLADGTRVRPDAELWMSEPGFEDRYLIEADCGTEGPSAIKRKFVLYRRLFQAGTEQETLGFFPQVLFVTLDDRRRAQIESQVKRLDEDVRPIFAVTHLSALPALLRWGPEGEVKSC
jgi:hypothetical protein